MTNNDLELVNAELWSTRADDEGHVVEAQYFLTVKSDGEPHDYTLLAMDASLYEGWFLERQAALAEVSTDEQPDVPGPLVVPSSVTAVTGLTQYLEQTFLNPSSPKSIRAIAANLLGPLEDDDLQPARVIIPEHTPDTES